MNKALIIVMALMISTASWAADMLTKTLPNGMDVVVKSNTSNQSVGIFFFVKTGSGYEDKYLGSGISHYLEHIVSGGSTTLHSEAYYSQKDQEMGAITNAYTAFDQTAFHTIVSKEYFSTALQTLSDHIQLCSFDSVEVAREQQVIAKEIIMRSTSPTAKMRQRYQSVLFSKSNKKNPNIGYSELFLKLKRADLVDYYNKRYAPNNIVLVVVGNIDVDLAMQEIQKLFSGFPRRTIEPVYLPTQPVIIGTVEHKEEFDIQLPVVYIDQIIPASDLGDYFALQATVDILFGKKYSPIRKKLYEEMQLVNYIYAYPDIDINSNSGLLHIQFEAKETAKVQEIIDILYKELDKYKKGYFTQKQLNALIHLYEAEYLLKARSVEDECLEIGSNMMKYGVPYRQPFFMANLAKVRPGDLNRMVQKYFNPSGKSTFFAVPAGQIARLHKAVTQDYVATELQKTVLGNGLTLLHKQNSQLPIVRGSILIPASSDFETENNAGYISFMTDMLFKGSRKYPLNKLTEWMENKAVTLDVSAGRNGISVSFSCLSSDLKELQSVLIDAFKNPAFDEQEIKFLQEKSNALAQRKKSDHDTYHSDFRCKNIYSDKRDQLSNKEKNDIIQRMTRKDVVETYNKYFRANRMTIAMVGDQSEAEARLFAQNIFNAFRHLEIDDTIKPLSTVVNNATYTEEYPFEEAIIEVNMKGPSCLDADFTTLKVIEAILGGSSGRIHYATRVVNNLSYSSTAHISPMRETSIIRATGQTSGEKAEQLKNVILNELNRMITEDVSLEEISRAVEENNIQMNNQITDEQIGELAVYYEQLGLGYDYLLNGVKEMRKVTPQDIRRVALKYLRNRDVIVSLPSADVKRMVDDKK